MSYEAVIGIQGGVPWIANQNITRFQGHEVIKVKVRHDLKMTLKVKFVCKSSSSSSLKSSWLLDFKCERISEIGVAVFEIWHNEVRFSSIFNNFYDVI